MAKENIVANRDAAPLEKRMPQTIGKMGGGVEWVVEAIGCNPYRLADAPTVRALCDDVVAELELTVIGEPQVHSFPAPVESSVPGGVTALYLLSESHLACHTYPEHGFATFNLYCCRRRPEWPWQLRLTDSLEADGVSVRELERDWRMVHSSQSVGVSSR